MLPNYICKIKSHNSELWRSMCENGGRKVIRYSIPYLRCTRSRLKSGSTLHEWNICEPHPDYQSDLCKKMLEEL